MDLDAFDWGALRRAMLLQIEIEASHSLQVPAESLSPGLRAALELGRNASPERRQRAAALMHAARAQAEDLLRRHEVLRLPATPQRAFPFDGPVPAGQGDYATLSSLLGLPVISVPAKVAPGELPVGIQLVGRKGEDAALLAAAAKLA